MSVARTKWSCSCNGYFSGQTDQLLECLVFLSKYYRLQRPLRLSPPVWHRAVISQMVSQKPSFQIELDPQKIFNSDKHTHKKEEYTLSHLNNHLQRILARIGYSEFSYFQIEGGFVLSTRLEQINADGSPKNGRMRWEPKLGLNDEFTFESVIKRIFQSPKGHYRVFLFVVSSSDILESDHVVSEETVISWLRNGAVRISDTTSQVVLADNHTCVAFVYEFYQKGLHSKPIFVDSNAIPAKNHLSASGFYAYK